MCDIGDRGQHHTIRRQPGSHTLERLPRISQMFQHVRKDDGIKRPLGSQQLLCFKLLNASFHNFNTMRSGYFCHGFVGLQGQCATLFGFS